ncbi:MAG: hypothetical protein M1838_000383 [Thelocarpon superellum]|nr:MAG: hypothetical protein M1838_000383 [Thelocarpon superellum]
MEEEDDDFYAPEDNIGTDLSAPGPSDVPPVDAKPASGAAGGAGQKLSEGLGDDEEDEEVEEDDESNSDIEIITERKDGSKAEPPPQSSRHNAIRAVPARAIAETTLKAAPSERVEASVKVEVPKSGVDYPAVRTSTIDVDAKPVYEPAGKPITEVNIDEDLKEHEKPWREPGTDVSDYFNYGFDEFTWSLYCLKQENTRNGILEDKKGFNMIMDGGGLPLPGLPNAGGPQTGMAMPPMPSMGDMGPDMMAQMAQMAQMMGSGLDPSQMDPSMFGMPQAPAGPSGGNPSQGFGLAQAGYGAQGPGGQQQQQQQQQQQMGFGYDPSMMGGDPNRNRQGNFGGGRGGRGQGRRNW